VFCGSHDADRGQSISPRLGKPGLCIGVEEVPGHPQLEIRGVEEANRWRPPRSRTGMRCQPTPVFEPPLA